jgi:alpha-beta hydrolase superfamily lysophospholipase
MPSVIGSTVTGDGTVLRTRHWPAGDPWASVLITHGLGEQSGR